MQADSESRKLSPPSSHVKFLLHLTWGSCRCACFSKLAYARKAGQLADADSISDCVKK